MDYRGPYNILLDSHPKKKTPALNKSGQLLLFFKMSDDVFYTDKTRVFNMKEKWFTLTDSMSIMDGETGKEVYKAVGKFFHLGVDMLIKDHAGSAVCEVKSKIISLMPEYDFYQKGKEVGKIRKEIGLLGERWHFTDLKRDQKWQISGDFVNYDWKIHKEHVIAGEVTRKKSLIKDHYGVSVEAGNDMLMILCVAVCMEKYHHDKSLL